MTGAAAFLHGTDQIIDAAMAHSLHTDARRDHALVACPCGTP